MTTFLFWNINRRPIANLIADVAETHEVDFLMLAESEITNSELLPKLNKDQRSIYFPEPLLSNYLKIYSRYSPQFIRPVTDSGRIAIRHLTSPSGKDILIVAVHLASKLYQSDQDQAFYCTRLARLI